MSRREAEAEDLVEKRGKVEVYRTLRLSEEGKADIIVAAGTAMKLHSGEGDPYVGVLREVLVVRRRQRGGRGAAAAAGRLKRLAGDDQERRQVVPPGPLLALPTV